MCVSFWCWDRLSLRDNGPQSEGQGLQLAVRE